MTKPMVVIENFDIQTELQCRCGCRRFNYDTEFLIRLQAFRYLYGKEMLVTSGGRCVQHNKDEGGVDTSCHQCETKKATAVDVTTGNCKTLYERACASGLFNEIIWYQKKNFVHLGLDRNQNGNYFSKV
jgi:hypothetical protein